MTDSRGKPMRMLIRFMAVLLLALVGVLAAENAPGQDDSFALDDPAASVDQIQTVGPYQAESTRQLFMHLYVHVSSDTISYMPRCSISSPQFGTAGKGTRSVLVIAIGGNRQTSIWEERRSCITRNRGRVCGR